MKLVTTRVDYTDSIVMDDGAVLGVIYYGRNPVDDTYKAPAEIFREWFERASAALSADQKGDSDEK